MSEFHSNHRVPGRTELSRRAFLKAGSLGAGAMGFALTNLAEAHSASRKDRNCILLFLVGGPSQLETWDLKPDAPSPVRGPFRPIKTNVPGMEICEHFPLLAQRADCFALLRSVHHDAAPIHETGHQLMQTGHLFRGGREYPHYGAVVSQIRGARSPGLPPFVVLPSPINSTGVSVSHGQGAGYLGARHEPLVVSDDPTCTSEPVVERGCSLRVPCELMRDRSPRVAAALDLTREKADRRARYGWNTFGQSCLLARRLLEHGVRLVTVNMFDTVFDKITWDCHADGGSLPATLDDYRTTLCPMFDLASSALLEDLSQRGMLETTLVVAMGEFGRTPHLNPRGGRDHWPGVWSVAFAGAGIKGGQVVGSSDRIGGEPKDRPASPAQVAATIYRALGIDPDTTLTGPDGQPLPLVESSPIDEMFRN
jgi:hypothetical protein